jgi:hypothetical protein
MLAAKTHCQPEPEMLNVNQAIQMVYENYGPNLEAFFAEIQAANDRTIEASKRTAAAVLENIASLKNTSSSF